MRDMSSHVAELGMTPYQAAVINLTELKERRQRLAWIIHERRVEGRKLATPTAKELQM